MVSPVLTPVLIALICVWSAHAVSSEIDNSQSARLSDFMRLQSNVSSVIWSLENNVELLRNSFIERIRCGSQHSIHRKACEDCLSSQRIFNITKRPDATIDSMTYRSPNITCIQDLSRVSVVFLNYFLSFQASCTSESIRYGYVGSCRVYSQCLAELDRYISSMNSSSNPENLETIEKILREIKAVYEPDPSKNCFSAEKILKELNTRSETFENVPREIATVLLITSHLLSGECIDVGESVADFLDDIFLHYGDGCERVITQSGFTKLWNDLQMQRRGKHINHGVQKSSCVYRGTQSSERQSISDREKGAPRYTTESISIETIVRNETVAEYTTKKPQHVVEYAVVTTSLQNQNKPRTTIWKSGNSLPVSDFTESKNATSDGTSKVTSESSPWKISTPQNPDLYRVDAESKDTEIEVQVVSSEEQNQMTTKRRARHMPFSEDHEHKNLANECLKSEDLLKRFLTKGNKVITSSEFMQLCPALVQQTVSGVCNFRQMTSVTSAESSKILEKNGTYVSTEASKDTPSSWYAVAAVTLITGASLLGLFLIPAMKSTSFNYIKSFLTGLAFGTMSGDVVLHITPQYLGLHNHDGDHDHHSPEESLFDRLFPSYFRRLLLFLVTMVVLTILESIFAAFSGEPMEHHGHSHDIAMQDLKITPDVENAESTPKLSLFTRVVNFLKPSNLFSGINSKAAVILLADTVHNFADGMAIAVGYATSTKDGVSTTVAVFFHELPHEIGDFVVLMNCGLGYWKAFAFNILSGLTAFLGVGVGVFTASAFREWLLCVTAGLFFFVVMGEMLPDMRMQSKAEWRTFVTRIVGTVCGVVIMIGIAVYELYSS